MVVFSFASVGAAWMLANLVYAALLHELVLVMGWPPREHTGTVFAMVGPLGQSASALLVLGDAVGRPDSGVTLKGSEVAGTRVVRLLSLEIICVLLAVLMGGLAVIWLLLGIVTIIYRTWRRELSWNPSWNGIVSPLATLAILCILLEVKMQTGFFGITACVVIVVCVLMVVVNLMFTIWWVTMTRRRRKQEMLAAGGE